MQTLLIMAEVQEAAGDDGQADSSLTRASELQATILARSRYCTRAVATKQGDGERCGVFHKSLPEAGALGLRLAGRSARASFDRPRGQA